MWAIDEEEWAEHGTGGEAQIEGSGRGKLTWGRVRVRGGGGGLVDEWWVMR